MHQRLPELEYRFPGDAMTVRPLKVAVVGAGLMGRFHASAARRNGGELVAIADTNVDNARALAGSAGSSVRAVSIDEVFQTADLDVVHVCTPPGVHAAMCRRVLEHGAHVMCEKPVASTGHETHELLRLAAAHNKLICAVHQFPFQDGVQRLLSEPGSVGRIRHLSAEICTAGADGKPEDERQQILFDVLAHPLSLFHAFGARPLGAANWSATVSAPGELSFAGARNGVGMSCVLSTRGRPTRNSLRVIGENGTATVDLFHGFSIVERGHVSRLRKASQPFSHSSLTLGIATANGIRRAIRRDTGFPGLRELVGRFYSAIANGKVSPTLPDDILDIAVARDRIIELCAAS